jgi:hypothetical protein
VQGDHRHCRKFANNDVAFSQTTSISALPLIIFRSTGVAYSIAIIKILIDLVVANYKFSLTWSSLITKCPPLFPSPVSKMLSLGPYFRRPVVALYEFAISVNWRRQSGRIWCRATGFSCMAMLFATPICPPATRFATPILSLATLMLLVLGTTAEGSDTKYPNATHSSDE